MPQRRELIKGSTDHLLLNLLGQQKMYGYQIIKELDSRSDGYFKFKEGTLYPALHRMEKAGLIKGVWEMAPSGRQRRYYQITLKGQELLSQERNQWQDFINAMRLVVGPANA
jgi:PadR family transcriptional regulator PadR